MPATISSYVTLDDPGSLPERIEGLAERLVTDFVQGYATFPIRC